MSVSIQRPVSAKALWAWKTLQIAGVVVTVALLAGFVLRPPFTLDLLWNVLIPILPATFLIAPSLWRGVCPLATLNTLANDRRTGRKLTPRALPVVSGVGILLLFALVPARRFLLNENGLWLAAIVIVVSLLALVLGFLFDSKSGFCNSICPVLPVEKLYGQHPLIEFKNPRCLHCDLCTPKGCIDLSPQKAISHAAGSNRSGASWLNSGFGIFAAVFPGFVIGYFQTANGPLSSAPAVYFTVATWAAASYVVVLFAAGVLKVRAATILPVVAAVAVAAYYWYVTPSFVETLAWRGSSTMVIRTVALTLTALWLTRAMIDLRHRSNGRQIPEPIALKSSSAQAAGERD